MIEYDLPWRVKAGVMISLKMLPSLTTFEQRVACPLRSLIGDQGGDFQSTRRPWYATVGSVPASGEQKVDRRVALPTVEGHYP
jgi:hypothetical protein